MFSDLLYSYETYKCVRIKDRYYSPPPHLPSSLSYLLTRSATTSPLYLCSYLVILHTLIVIPLCFSRSPSSSPSTPCLLTSLLSSASPPCSSPLSLTPLSSLLSPLSSLLSPPPPLPPLPSSLLLSPPHPISRTLGLIYWTLFILIVIYIFGFVIVVSKGYLDYDNPVGIVRARLIKVRRGERRREEGGGGGKRREEKRGEE